MNSKTIGKISAVLLWLVFLLLGIFYVYVAGEDLLFPQKSVPSQSMSLGQSSLKAVKYVDLESEGVPGVIEQEAEPESTEVGDIHSLTVDENLTDENETVEPENPDYLELSVDEQPAKTVNLPAPIVPITDDDLRIGFITDLHVRSFQDGTARKLKEEYAERIDYFVEKMNNSFGPSFIIVNGDIIEGTQVPAVVGFEELQLTKERFDRTRIPKYWVMGNHDLRSVNKARFKDAFGMNYSNYSFETSKYKIIILDSNFTAGGKDVEPGSGYTRGNVSQAQFNWLEGELENSPKKAVVFLHHPPLRGLESSSDSGLLLNALELQKIFSKHEVLAVFSGHIEDLYYDKLDGVKYYVIPGMTKNERYQASFVEISLRKNKIKVELNYLVGKDKYKEIEID